LSFLSGLVEHSVFQENQIYTRFVDENLDAINLQVLQRKQGLNRHLLAIAYLIFHFHQKKSSGNSVWNEIGFWRMMSRMEVFVDDEKMECSSILNSGNQIFRINQQDYEVSVIQMNGDHIELKINKRTELFYCLDDKTQTHLIYKGFSFSLRSNSLMRQALLTKKNAASEKVFQNLICADLFGKVLKLNISKGDVVKTGQVLLTLESMKTEIHVLCPVDAQIKKIHVVEGNAVTEKQLLVELEEKSVQSQ
jgi:acetyl/propionyl-CoA carboxylase alpha subunit